MQRPTSPLLLRRGVLIRVAVVLGATWLVSLGAVLTWGVQDDAQAADAIIVMGAAQYRGKPSPALRARLEHAVVLWRRGLAPLMVLTGGIGEGDTASEAAVSRAFVMSAGIPDGAILLENEGRTSSQSLRGAANLLYARRLKTAIVVSDPFHMLRLEILGRRYGLNPYTSPALPPAAAQRLWHQWGSFVAESFKAPLALVIDW
jgi:uncharacterized SAM-binding protein YcdF (DUF218 family)